MVRPADDTDAATMALWGADVAAKASSCGHTVQPDLQGSLATRPQVDLALSQCDVFFFFGHGRKARLLSGTVNLVDSVNVGNAAKQVIVAMACWSADTLGPDAQQRGVRGYLGFDERFAFLTGDPDRQFGPATVKCCHELLQGQTLGQAASTLERELDTVFDYYSTGQGSTGPNAALGWLAAYWDKQHVKRIGPPSVTI